MKLWNVMAYKLFIIQASWWREDRSAVTMIEEWACLHEVIAQTGPLNKHRAQTDFDVTNFKPPQLSQFYLKWTEMKTLRFWSILSLTPNTVNSLDVYVKLISINNAACNMSETDPN